MQIGLENFGELDTREIILVLAVRGVKCRIFHLVVISFGPCDRNLILVENSC